MKLLGMCLVALSVWGGGEVNKDIVAIGLLLIFISDDK